jgi:acetyltransferase-like isoleucine patch superfamily enzyme
MLIKGRKISFWLLIAKMIKVCRIRLAIIIPTITAKITLRLLECPYGKNLKINGKVYFRPNGKGTIKIGDNVSITARFLSNNVGITNPAFLECSENGEIQIGNNTGLTSPIISSRLSIKIGNYVNIGGNVRIFDHDFHSLNYLDRRENDSDLKNVKKAEVIIEDDVFIGTNAIILKGVHIGARSIIAAGSVVSLKNIPHDTLVGGNPAKIIKCNINRLAN